jgi:sortase A
VREQSQSRLLVSSARIVLAVVVICLSVAGEPPPAVQIAAGAPTRLPAPSSRGSLRRRGVVPPSPSAQPVRGNPTRIQAGSIDLDAPVVEAGWSRVDVDGEEVIEWEVPDGAAGHHVGSALPGECGNTVISGHNNIGGEVFRRLIDLSLGDEVRLYVGDAVFRYRVEQKEILRQAGASAEERRENARFIGPTDDERLTLVTCWPDTGNSHRLIVVARPVQ